MLLDTNVLQNIEWVWDRLDGPSGGHWADVEVVELQARYGTVYADELLCLGYLVDRLQWQYFPWVVSTSSLHELTASRRCGAEAARRGWYRIYHNQEEEASSDFFRGVSASLLTPTNQTRVNPLVLRGLGVGSIADITKDGGPLDFLGDAEDLCGTP